jgi:hypothetical protein
VEIEYFEKRALMDRSQAKLDEYPDLPKWIGYKLPASDADQAQIISTLLNSSFKLDDVITLEGAPAPSAIQIESVADYITRQREAGVNEDLIAWELYNKKGSFRLTNLNVARALGLDTGYNSTQIPAIKQRAQRARERGMALLQKQKDSPLNV